MTIVLGLLFFLWFAASVATHFHAKTARRLRKMDRFGLIPSWRFFVANPLRYEFSVVAKSPSSPESVLPPPRPRNPFYFLLNPHRLDSKAHNDLLYYAYEANDTQAREALSEVLAQHNPSITLWQIQRYDNLTKNYDLIEEIENAS